MNANANKGFTLIELLVVIAIIGLLSSVILANLNTARLKARDAQRITSIGQLQTALELYYNDTGHYPNTSNNVYADCWLPGSNWIPDSGNYNWSTGYIAKQPQDPIDNCCWPDGNCGAGQQAGTYEYWSNGQKYTIAAELEDRNSSYRSGITHPGIADPNCSPTTFEAGGCWGLGQYVYVIGN